MNILMLTDVFFPDTIGGAGRVAYHVGLGLSQKGHDVHIITRNTDEKLTDEEQLSPNMKIHRFNYPQKESPTLFISEIKKSYILAKQLVLKIDFDMICTHQSLVALGPIRLKYLKKLPLVYYYHSPWHEEYLIKKSLIGKPGINTRLVACIMRWMENTVVSKADRVIVLSDYMRNKVSQLHHYPENKIVKIPGGIDLDRFHLPDEGKVVAKSSLNFPQDKTIFLTVRNLVPRMGLENLINAFNASEVLQRKALLLIGGKGPLEQELRSKVYNNNLKDVIRFLGHIPDQDLPTFYQAADFFILPTEKLEGFGLVILESMACGTPVLGTPVGAIPEVIGSFDKNLVFDGPDSSDIQQRLENVLSSPEIYSYSPSACRDFVENSFSWEKVVEMLEEEMKSLV